MDNNSFWINLIAKLKKDQSKQQIKTDVKSLGDIFIKLTGKLDLVKTRKNIKSQLKDLNNNSLTITPTVNKKGVQNATKQAVDNAQKTANSKKIQIDFEVNKQKLINQIKILGKDNSKLFNNSEISAKYNQLLDSAKIAKSNSELKSLRGQLSAFRTELKATNNAGMTWIDKFKASISSFAQYFSGASFIYAMTNQLKNAWVEAKTLDDSLVDLQKVTDEIDDRDALYKYFDRAMSKAQELNVKVDSLLYAITEFKKLGWSLSDAEIGGQWATILENVGDVSIDEAIGSIKTTIASFDEIGGYGNDQIDKKIEAYVDLINNMSNKYSIDAESLSEAIRLSAGTLREAHTNVEQAATIFSTANKYYNDASYLGNTLKIGSLRMRASKGDSNAVAELVEMGEEIDNLTEATSNLREQLLSLTGVDIMVDEHTFKSYYDQLYEISQVIDGLSDTSRANVLETLFGKNRSAAGAAILSGMKESTDAYEEAINSAGSATKEYETWMQSADAATQRFANNLTQTYQSIVNGNTVRDLSNLGSTVLEFGNSWGIVEGTIKGVIVLGLGKFLTTSTMAIITATKSVEQYGRALQLANNIPDGNLATRYKTLRDIAQATSLLTDDQKKQVLSSQLLSEQDRIRILSMQGMTNEIATQKLAEMGLTNATNAQTAATTASTASTFSFSAAVRGLGANLKAAFLSNPVGIAIMAISTAVGFVTSAISKHNQKLEEARQKAVELTNAYKEQQSSLESQIAKYKELKESLDKGNLSTEETRSIKEQLLEIQNSLIDSYGNEASNIDLVNGKYREQLGLLEELSKEKATDYVIQHRDQFETAKKELEKIRTYDLGSVTSWTSKVPKTEDQQKLIEFIEAYSELFDLQTNTTSYGGQFGGTFTDVTLSVKANAEDAEEVIKQFAKDLEIFAEENNIDVSSLLKVGIPEQARSIWTDELEKYKTIYDEFMTAEIIRNDTLRPLYKDSIQAVEAYNKAISSGEGVEEARANLDAVQQSVQDATGELEGSQAIFDDIYDGINKNAEAAYNLDQAFENDKTVKDYAEQLRGLSDVDLKAINFDNNNLEEGEEAFKGLVDALGLTDEQAQTVIDKLVELGYVQGKVKGNTFNDETPDVLLSISSTIDQLNTKLKPAFDSLKSAYQDIFTDDGFKLNSIDILSTCDSIKSKLDEIAKFNPDLDYSAYENFVRVLSNTDSTTEDVKNAFNYLATSITNAALSGTEDFTTMKAALECLGVVNNELVAFDALISNTEALKEAGLDLTEVLQLEAEGTDEATAKADAMIAAFAKEMVSTDNLSQAIAMLTFQKELYNLQDMNSEDEVANLRTLAENAGYTGEVIQWLTELEQIYQTIASGVLGTNNQQVGMARQRAAELQKLIAESANNIEYKPKVDFDGIKKDASSAAKSASNSIKDSIDSYMNYMEKSLESGRISFQEYSRDVSAYLKQMYDSGKISAQDYFDYQKQMLETQKSIYDKVLSAVTRRIDKEIDKYEELIDEIKKENDALNAKKDEYDAILSVVESVYDKEIDRIKEQQDAIDDTIKKLRDENDETQRGIELEQARWNLYKAMTQRNVKLYNGREYTYVQNRDEVRSAQQNIADLELEETISALEKERDALDESINLLEQYKQQWLDIADAKERAIKEQLAIDLFGKDYEDYILQNRITDIEAFKEKYLEIQDKIEDNTKLIESYQEKIEYYEKLKKQWQDIADAYEQSMEDQYAAMILGANWEADVLSGRVDVLNNFKDAYISIQKAIVDYAWWSANEQIKAYQAAQSAQGSVGGGGGNDGNDGGGSKYSKEDAVKAAADIASSALDDALKQAKSKSGGGGGGINSTHKKGNAHHKYHSGLDEGYVGDNPTKDQKLAMLRYYSDDLHEDEVPAILQEGEVVLTSKQQDNILENLRPISQEELWEDLIRTCGNGKYNNPTSAASQNNDAVMPKQQDVLEFLLNNKVIPDYNQMFGLKDMESFRNSNKVETVDNSTKTIVYNNNISFPNITNESGYDQVVKALKQTELDALQDAHKRKR